MLTVTVVLALASFTGYAAGASSWTVDPSCDAALWVLFMNDSGWAFSLTWRLSIVCTWWYLHLARESWGADMSTVSCIDTVDAQIQVCPGNDWQCLCTNYKTLQDNCYANCPNDPSKLFPHHVVFPSIYLFAACWCSPIKAWLLLRQQFFITATRTLLLYPWAAPLAVVLEPPLPPARRPLPPPPLVHRARPLPVIPLPAPLLRVVDLRSHRPIVMVLWLVSWPLLALFCSLWLVVTDDLPGVFLFSFDKLRCAVVL